MVHVDGFAVYTGKKSGGTKYHADGSTLYSTIYGKKAGETKYHPDGF